MVVDIETTNVVTALVNSVSTEDNKFRVELYNKVYNNLDFSEWTDSQDVKLLTLDGSFGGRSGSEFDFLSTDLEAQDDWHIGKKYDMQGWFRYPVIIEHLGMGVRRIYIAKDDGEHNAYLVISKRMLREKSKNLKRAKTEELEKIANKMVDKYISSFNAIGRGNVFYLHFFKGDEACVVGDIYEDLLGRGYNEDIFNEIMSNLPYTDKEFDKLIKEILTFDYNSEI